MADIYVKNKNYCDRKPHEFEFVCLTAGRVTLVTTWVGDSAIERLSVFCRQVRGKLSRYAFITDHQGQLSLSSVCGK